MRVLLVEDDPMLGESLRDALRAQGYVTDWVSDGFHALTALTDERFDLAIVDLGLPRMDGIEVISNVRSRGIDLPILVLTARDSTGDKVKGLDAGADDYLLKPFDLHELQARLRALLRRQGRQTISNTIECDTLCLDPDAFTVTLDSQPVALSRREFALLEVFMKRRGQVLTRQQLEQAIYSWDDDVGSNALEVHIHHLRKKLGNDLIRTIRGIGYVFDSTRDAV